MSLKNLLFYVLIVLPIVSVGCAGKSSVQVLLEQSQQKWAEQGIDSYGYQLQISCFCPPDVTQPVIVTVRGGATTSIINAVNSTPVENGRFEKYSTVDKLFDIISTAIENNAAEISVSYDEKFGYPTRIYIDSIKQAIDDEIAYNISGFQAQR